MGSILSAVQVPDRGGDTLFADLVDAYRTLSPGVRALIDPLVAVHDTLGAFERVATEGGLGQLTAIEPVRHPVVRVHPETGARGLFVNPVFTSRIEGLSRLESEHLLDLLYEHCTNPSASSAGAGATATWPSGTSGPPPTTPAPTTPSGG